MTLAESLPGTLFDPLPVVQLEPVVKNKVISNTHMVYECPVYKTCERAGVLSTTGLSTNYILSLHIPIARSSSFDHWVCRGVAALCQIDT